MTHIMVNYNLKLGVLINQLIFTLKIVIMNVILLF
jgi:hypothetical protein